MRRCLAVCALVLGVSALAHAQVDRATLSGTVTRLPGRARLGRQRGDHPVRHQRVGPNQDQRGGQLPRGEPVARPVPDRGRGPRASRRAPSRSCSRSASAGAWTSPWASGASAEDVTVEDARRLLNTEQAALGSVIDQNAVAKLPLAIRNWDDLLALVPGVQGDRYTEQGGGTSFGRTGGVNVHGARALQNNFLLDGVDNNSISENVQELTTQVSRPSVDAIQEFKIVTSPYSAEYGRSPGAAISVSTKSGTNEFHGTAYDFFRNDSLDTIDFFSKRAAGLTNTSAVKPANDQNQFGGNLGGPIDQGQGLLLRRLRGHAHHPRRHAAHPRPDRRASAPASSRARSATRSPASPSRAT